MSPTTNHYQFPLIWMFGVTTTLACGFAVLGTNWAPLAYLVWSPLPVVVYVGVIRLIFIRTDVQHQNKWPLSDFTLGCGLSAAGLISLLLAFASFAALVRGLIE